MDTDNSDDEEEYTVYVDFGSHFPFDDFLEPDPQIKLIGLDTKQPIAQINGRFYEGEYDFAMGTKLLFGLSSDEPESYSQDWFGTKDPAEPYTFFDKTNKVLKMKRIFISKKEDEDSSQIKEELNSKKYEMESTYGEALGKFLAENRKAPRVLTSEENGDDLVARTGESNNT